MSSLTKPTTDSLKVLRTVSEFQVWRKNIPGCVGLVPTMGALHPGHLELVRYARSQCDELVVSIFVNPTQFSPGEDFEQYPRRMEKDLEALKPHQVDAVFAPSVGEMYPDNFSTYIDETIRSRELCGRFRPGHFRGVCTVVHRLFSVVRPDLAVFGLKDAQQYFVIQKMVADLNLGVEVHGYPTVRESDGLAMSSRNQYLATEQRTLASAFYRVLSDTADLLSEGLLVRDALKKGRDALSQRGFELQYLELMTLPDIQPVQIAKIPKTEPYLLASSVFLGKTRLIDNVILGQDVLVSRRLNRA